MISEKHMATTGLILTLLVPAVIAFSATPGTATLTPSRAALFQGTVALRSEVVGVHPRLFITPAELEATIARFHREPACFASWIPNRKSKPSKPQPLDEGEKGKAGAQTVMQLAILWRVTGEAKYLQAIEAWIPTMEAFQPLQVKKIGGVGNRDLTSGGLLCGFAAAYDLLKGKAGSRLETAVRRVLVGQAKQLYADLVAIPSYPYEQNHLTIPVCGLAVAALATCDELPEAQAWLVFSHNVLDRCLKAVAYDGWFFEGVSYWNFTMEYPLLYAAALRRTTGEDLFRGQFFGNTAFYLAHTFLPGSRFVFDFADWGPRVNSDGTTAQRGYDAPWHTLPTSLSKYVPLHHETTDPALRSVIEKITSASPKEPGEPDRSFALLWGYQPPSAASQALDMPPFHYFPDMDVVHWRANWTDPAATALAFKSGPPAGHHIAQLYPLYSEWRPGLGHAHPDAGSFLLFSRGVFLANDTGYAVKASRWHNTLTVDGAGQGTDSTPWSTWATLPYETLNRTRMCDVWLGSNVAASTAVFEAAYPSTMKLRTMRRHLILVAGRFLVVADEIQSDIPHTYDWYLHTDRPPLPLGENRWKVENGPARLLVQSLGPMAPSSRVEPTVVETELYDKKNSRPQQRGYHLNLRSPATDEFRFLTAMGIQSLEDPEERFRATATSPHQLDLRDGPVSCRIWIDPQPGLDGTFAFLLREGNQVTAIGLSGRRLDTEAGRIEVSNGGQVILRPKTNAASGWTAECEPSLNWTIQSKRKL
jgi:hypothetical protein